MFEILPDLVISAETDPVRKGAVLLHLLAEDALGLKGLVRRLFPIKCIKEKLVRKTIIKTY